MSASSVVRRGVVSFTLSFVAALGMSAQAPTGRALAIEDYYRVKTVGGPELSPDGKVGRLHGEHARRGDERQHERSMDRRLRRIVAAEARERRRRERDGARSGSTTVAFDSRATAARWCSIRRRPIA